MKILMIAPEPVFQPRGTPFSVSDRCRVLADLGHKVDLLTYPIGEDLDIPGVTLHRTRGIPGIKDIKIGFSWRKIPLDGLLFIKTFLALRNNVYDIIHTHEEAGMIGAILGPLFRVPHLYDMHSSLPQQFENYGTSTSGPIMRFMRWTEKFILKRSHGVIAICPHLREIALESAPNAPVIVIENLAQMGDKNPDPANVAKIKEKNDLNGKFVIGYTGTFEVNQGLDILVESFAVAAKSIPEAVLFLVGGRPDQIEKIRDLCKSLKILDQVRLPGNMPVQTMSDVMEACNILASPRSIGTNTPLKLYSYLKAGIPILGTDLLTHTQVLDDSVAVLVPPTPEKLAQGIIKLHSDPELRKKLSANAIAKEKSHYSYPAYKEKVAQLISTFPERTDHKG